jgi:hypothetical protein
MKSHVHILVVSLTTLLCGQCFAADSGKAGGWRRSRLKGNTPTREVLHFDMDGDGKPDILERWWNGRRVRWLDENGDMRPDDARGDMVGDVMQVDRNNNGIYDDSADLNIKWADGDGDGLPETQAITEAGAGAHWMIFHDFDNQARLGSIDWRKFDLDCWAKDATGAWRQNYHGNNIFLKIHRSPGSLKDPRMNWENPFAFYDLDDDGMPEAAVRWAENDMNLEGRLAFCMVTYDLANTHAEGSETAYTMSLGGFGGPGVPYKDLKQPLPGLKGLNKFDPCFLVNNWRRVDTALCMPYDRCFPAFFTARWQRMFLVFDEDGDNRRWERVEFMSPDVGEGRSDQAGKMVDLWSTGRKTAKHPGLCAGIQSDSLGDRGEFDLDNSGNGQLYVGAFDRKLHLLGAEWGAWTVDAGAAYHGGTNWTQSSFGKTAPRVGEVVRYTDTDNNGFIDTIEYDYNGDRTFDRIVRLLDYRTPENPHPDVVATLDTAQLGWKGLHERFTQMAKESWTESMRVYQAAWRKGLTSPETEALATAASRKQQHRTAYWLKEKTIRLTLAHLAQRAKSHPEQAAACKANADGIARWYALGDTGRLLQVLAQIPGK